MADHEVVSREEWAALREKLLAREKEHTRFGDELERQRRELPWVRVEKEYRFDTDDGTAYQTYGTTARGLEFLMGYDGILDRAPKGRDEGGESQIWIRRHDEY